MQSNLASEAKIQPADFRIGFYLKSFADLERSDFEIALHYWVNEVSKQVEISTSAFFYDDIDTMRNDFNQQNINFITAAPQIIINHFDLNDLAEGYKMIWDGSAEDNLLLITHKQFQLNRVTDLKNKRLSLLSNDHTPQIYADILSLEHFGKKANAVFKKITRIRKSNQLILDLFFKKTDAILVYQKFYNLAIELNPQIKQSTQIISVLPNIPRALGYFHKSVDPNFRQTVLTEINNMHTNAKGQQLLNIFLAEKTINSTISDLKSTQQLVYRYQQLINKNQGK